MIRKLVFLAAAAAVALSAMPAAAGVIIHETQTTVRGAQAPTVDRLTVMVQGNKQIMVTQKHTIIIDLDASKLMVLDPASKTYVELPFPPQGQLGRMMAANTAVNLARAHGEKTVAGYKCRNYQSSGTTRNTTYEIHACFSNNVPGAKEYTAFQKAMAARLRAVSNVPAGHMPDGVALALDSTRTITSFNVPGISAKQKAALQAMIKAQSPVVSKTLVTRVEAANLPASRFAPPADFKKQAMPQMRMPAQPMHKGAEPVLPQPH